MGQLPNKENLQRLSKQQNPALKKCGVFFMKKPRQLALTGFMLMNYENLDFH
jgi:hypothetical protein